MSVMLFLIARSSDSVSRKSNLQQREDKFMGVESQIAANRFAGVTEINYFCKNFCANDINRKNGNPTLAISAASHHSRLDGLLLIHVARSDPD